MTMTVAASLPLFPYLADRGLLVNEYGIITTKGAFEGVPAPIPEVFDRSLEGDSLSFEDENGHEVVRVEVDGDLRRSYPAEFAHVQEVWIWQDDQGFVRFLYWESKAAADAEAAAIENTL